MKIHAFWSIRDLDRRDNPEHFGKNKGWLTLKHFQLRDEGQLAKGQLNPENKSKKKLKGKKMQD